MAGARHPHGVNASKPRLVDLSTVVEERRVRERIPRLYEAGAPGIIEVSIDKIIQ